MAVTMSAVSVIATDTACTLSVPTVKAGTVQFVVSNSGTQATTFNVLGADGTTALAQIEDIGPGASGTLQYPVMAGSYGFACEPGMAAANQLRGTFSVTG
jgi:iron uptake system component EfeO